ncbi:MAG: hypothetical protein ACRD1U_05280 [Vicinamibacterales bacterium]
MTPFLSARVLVLMVLTSVAIGTRAPRMHAQAGAVLWIDALCGSDPVSRHLHQRMNDLARARQWETRTAPGGCEWVTDTLAAAARERALERNAQAIAAAIGTPSGGRTVVVLTNSMVAARLGDLRPAVLNPRLVARDMYLFAADPKLLCDRTRPIKVGYLRGTARRVEIVGTLSADTGRLPSQIDAREVDMDDFAALLGDSSGGLDVAALVSDDIGGIYEEFKAEVMGRNAAVKPVSLCQPPDKSVRLEKRLDGSVSYLKVAMPPDSSIASGSLVALMRPGQEPTVVPPRGWFARWTESLFATGVAAGQPVKPSDFADFPVLLAAGPGERALAEDQALQQVLSHCYFEGMYDALAGGLNPCRERADMLFGVYLLSSYLEDTTSAYKGCALQAYYELMSSTSRRPGTARKNVDLLKARPALAACLNNAASPASAAQPSPAAPRAACDPSDKSKLEARDYGPHYAYYREGMSAIATALAASGPAREQTLRMAESCLIRALEMSQERTCDKFSQGLFVVPYEPSLPLGIVHLKGGK